MLIVDAWQKILSVCVWVGGLVVCTFVGIK
jgi:hypothetical protein